MKVLSALCLSTLMLVCCSTSKSSSSPGSEGGVNATGGASVGTARGGREAGYGGATSASGGLASGAGGSASGAGRAGGSASGAGGGGGEGGSDDCPAVIDSDGNIEAPCVGVRGHWYSLADSLGPNGAPPGICQSVGMHPNSECSQPELLRFLTLGEGEGNKVCATGTIARVSMLDGELDFLNQWGVSIGFDFAATSELGNTFDAAATGVRGVAFELDQRPLPGLRVEFYDARTAGGQDAAYWGATSSYPPSPVRVGVNEITWDRVASPIPSVPALDTTQLVSMVFHVPASSVQSSTYQFCISHVKLLR